MHYLGGKFRTQKQISAFLNQKIQEHSITEYYEPFCGSCWITHNIICEYRYASDIHPDLIFMWKALQGGWEPPGSITEEEYRYLRQQHISALRGFVGFACSFGGKWFGGYARCNRERNYCRDGKNSILRRLPKLMDVKFRHISYDQLHPRNALVYCGPPYANTTKYTMKFDSTKFWEVMREYSLYNKVYISEYTAPNDFECVLEIQTKTDLKDKNNQMIPRTERLFTYKGNSNES
jgi:DNA adenine methylase